MERFIASNATVIGDVTLSEDVTIWYQAVLRGDSNWIKVGQRTNIQDGTIIHVDHDAPVDIAENVTVGHQCMLHGCTIDKVIRPLTKEEIQKNKENIQHYVEIGRMHAQGKFKEQR